MTLDRDPNEVRSKLEKPPTRPARPAQSPWIALVAVLVIGVAAWWMLGGNEADEASTPPSTPVASEPVTPTGSGAETAPATTTKP